MVTTTRHLYSIIRYDFNIGRTFRIRPLTYFATDFATGRLDNWVFLGADNLTKVLTRVNVGVGYRLTDGVMLAGELVFKWFRIGYSYDIIFSKLSTARLGSHEFTLRMHLFKSGGAKAGTELE